MPTNGGNTCARAHAHTQTEQIPYKTDTEKVTLIKNTKNRRIRRGKEKRGMASGGGFQRR